MQVINPPPPPPPPPPPLPHSSPFTHFRCSFPPSSIILVIHLHNSTPTPPPPAIAYTPLYLSRFHSTIYQISPQYISRIYSTFYFHLLLHYIHHLIMFPLHNIHRFFFFFASTSFLSINFCPSYLLTSSAPFQVSNLSLSSVIALSPLSFPPFPFTFPFLSLTFPLSPLPSLSFPYLSLYTPDLPSFPNLPSLPLTFPSFPLPSSFFPLPSLSPPYLPFLPLPSLSSPSHYLSSPYLLLSPSHLPYLTFPLSPFSPLSPLDLSFLPITSPLSTIVSPLSLLSFLLPHYLISPLPTLPLPVISYPSPISKSLIYSLSLTPHLPSLSPHLLFQSESSMNSISVITNTLVFSSYFFTISLCPSLLPLFFLSLLGPLFFGWLW
ncbi:proline-rich protein 36-like [Eriocheir sinensis]|uniref:proline-rich protein 36-like n=1 Tax=Eriocheir sinensis TaxID=95602 RepID=UPI0021C8F6BE|nr:proline-rich protein 36-like [Eriocheir sinensis]XP_050739532.1 proline-rich protein 36-like [Eriocheir sinensis]XP_050739536.1 proline-rich protein 36-like [Eriocheir sinensis]XP_050739544.1 proline-rich protein 36-like [Eriocheir sinensis]XP_050739551.1 proline-rich protein 36-like [Eriocheir sinensis]